MYAAALQLCRDSLLPSTVGKWACGAVVPLVAAAAALCSPHARPQAQAQAQAPLSKFAALVPVENFFGRTEMASLSLSPSGRHLAYLRTLPSGRNALLTLDLQNPQKPVALATFSDADVFGVRWVGDDFLVFSLTDDEAGSGASDFAPGLYSVARSGGETLGLVRTRKQFVVDGTFARHDRRLEHNHCLLQVPQDNSGEVIVGQLERGAGALTTVAPLRLHVHTQRTRKLELAGAPSGVNQWLFDGLGQPRVALVAVPGRVQVHWRAPASAEWKRILDADRLHMPWRPVAVDAAGALYVVHARRARKAPMCCRVLTLNAAGRPKSHWFQCPGSTFAAPWWPSTPAAAHWGCAR